MIYNSGSAHRSGNTEAPQSQLEKYTALDKSTIAVVSRDAILAFFDGIQLPTITYKRDIEFEDSVKNQIKSWGLDSITHGHEVTGITLATTAYDHIARRDTKLHIALYTALEICLDGNIVANPSTFRDFHRRFHLGLSQKDSLLHRFTDLLTEMPNYFSWFASNAIVTSSLEFINATLLECDSTSLVLNQDAMQFLDYRRRKSANGEAFAYFIWEKEIFPDAMVYMQAIPDVMLYIERVNDILSFYKEELAGETENYIKDRALVTKMSTQDTLRQVIEEVIEATKRVRLTLGEGKARDAWDSFARGYVYCHIGCPRYRLREILGQQYFIEESSSS